VKENIRAKLWQTAKNILPEHGCLPDEKKKATRMVLEQTYMITRQVFSIQA
jgi:hypothetical protein